MDKFQKYHENQVQQISIKPYIIPLDEKPGNKNETFLVKDEKDEQMIETVVNK